MMNSTAVNDDNFVSYENEYKTIIKILEPKIKTDILNAQGELKKKLVRSAEREFDECEEILASLETEVNAMPAASRSPFYARFKGYKNQLLNLKREMKRNAQVDNNRDLLFGNQAENNQRATLLSGTERLNQSSVRLENSHRMALETEQLGAGILTDLRSQREQIVNTRDTLREADSSLDTAQKTLKEMARRMMMNRFMAIGIISLLVALILLILYFKFA